MRQLITRFPIAPALVVGLFISLLTLTGCLSGQDDGVAVIFQTFDEDSDGFLVRDPTSEDCNTLPADLAGQCGEALASGELSTRRREAGLGVNDCDNRNVNAFPGAAELDSPTDCMQDADMDGRGDNLPQNPRIIPGTDCDDNDVAINIDAIEICDGVDNNCSGEIDDSDECQCLEDTDCAETETCESNSCVEITCDPADACDDVVIIDRVCTHTARPSCCLNDTQCQNGDFCDGAEVCAGNICSPALNVPCTNGLLCNEETDQCGDCFTDEDCADSELCAVDNTCLEITCDPADACDDVVIIDRVCTHTARPGCCLTDEECGNGLFCDGQEACVDNACTDAPDPCTDGLLCEEDLNQCGGCFGDEDCADNEVCNEENVCEPVICEPQDACNTAEVIDRVCVQTELQDCCLSNDDCTNGICLPDQGLAYNVCGCDNLDDDAQCTDSRPGDLPDTYQWGCQGDASLENLGLCTSCRDEDLDGFCDGQEPELCNGLDENGDGEIDEDCNDNSCVSDRDCPLSQICTAQICADGCRSDQDCADQDFCLNPDQNGIGQCSTNECQNDVDCGDGEQCVNNACEVDLCFNVTCDTPPAPTCSLQGQRVTYTAPGTCLDGLCNYDSTAEDCPQGQACSDGACVVVDPGQCGPNQQLFMGSCVDVLPAGTLEMVFTNDPAGWNGAVETLHLVTEGKFGGNVVLPFQSYASGPRDAVTLQFQINRPNLDSFKANVFGQNAQNQSVDFAAARVQLSLREIGSFGYRYGALAVDKVAIVDNGQGGADWVARPNIDSDGDGLLDGVDACPFTSANDCL